MGIKQLRRDGWLTGTGASDSPLVTHGPRAAYYLKARQRRVRYGGVRSYRWGFITVTIDQHERPKLYTQFTVVVACDHAPKSTVIPYRMPVRVEFGDPLLRTLVTRRAAAALRQHRAYNARGGCECRFRIKTRYSDL